MKNNSIKIITPYKHNDQWVFGDERVKLEREPFVNGADTLIDAYLERISMPDCEIFNLAFSENNMNGRFDISLTKLKDDYETVDGKVMGGATYLCHELYHEAWLCPALLCYFEKPPMDLYCKIQPLVKVEGIPDEMLHLSNRNTSGDNWVGERP